MRTLLSHLVGALLVVGMVSSCTTRVVRGNGNPVATKPLPPGQAKKATGEQSARSFTPAGAKPAKGNNGRGNGKN